MARSPAPETSLDHLDTLMSQLERADLSSVQPQEQTSLPASGPATSGQRGIGGPRAAPPSTGVVSSGPGPALLAARQKQMEQAKIRMAKVDPLGRKIIATGLSCGACDTVIVGRVLNVLDKTYHPECLKCAACRAALGSGPILEHGSSAYCEPCWWNAFGPRCHPCNQPIKERAITFGTRRYHCQHFSCVGCGKPLQGGPVKEYESDPYCNYCFGRIERVINPAAHPCAICKRPIFGEYREPVPGQKIHPEHYKCEGCCEELRNGDCHEYDGKLYCEVDYRKLLKSICFGCRKPITGRSVTAMGRVWHPEHFVCATCHEPFPISNFFEHEGKPYCDRHYASEFAPACGRCDRSIIGTALFALGKYWHHEHYQCASCDRLLGTQDATVLEWEGRPFCGTCYYRLPKDVRDANEKRKAAERQAQQRRLKEERAEARRHGEKG